MKSSLNRVTCLSCHLHEVRKAHEVAVGMDNEGRSEVASLDEQEGRVHAEDSGVGELEHGDEEGGHDVVTLPDPLDHVVEVSHAEEQRANDDCPKLGIVS